MSKPTMNTQDAVSANFAECFVTIDGTRYSMLMAKEFEGTASVNTAEVYKLGGVVVGHKAQTVALSFSMTIYKCTEIFDKVVEDFIKTGVMPTFDIQTSNDDPATTVGRSTKIYNNCILDGDVLLSIGTRPLAEEAMEFAGVADKMFVILLRATVTALPVPNSTPTRPTCKAA